MRVTRIVQTATFRRTRARIWNESVANRLAKLLLLSSIFYNVDIFLLKAESARLFGKILFQFLNFHSRKDTCRRQEKRIYFVTYHECGVCVVSKTYRPTITRCRLRRRSIVIKRDMFLDQNLDGIVINVSMFLPIPRDRFDEIRC